MTSQSNNKCQNRHAELLAKINPPSDENPFMQTTTCPCGNAFILFLNLLSEAPISKIPRLVEHFGNCQVRQGQKLSSAQVKDVFSALLTRNPDRLILGCADRHLFAKKEKKDADFKTEVSKCLLNATSRGELQSTAIEWAFKNNLIKAEILQYAFLIGLDDPNTVTRPANWIDFSEAEPAIQTAIAWRKDKNQWCEAVAKLNLIQKPYVVTYERFCQIMAKYPEKDLSPRPEIQKFIQKHQKGRLNFVQLFEILYYRIAEAPELKEIVIRILQESNLQPQFVAEIQRIDFKKARPNIIPEMSNDQLKNLPTLLAFLRVNPNIPVISFSSKDEIIEFSKKLHKEVAKSDYPFVGFNLQWNEHAKKPENQVKYLQFALKDAVYMFKITGANSKELEQLCEVVFPREKLTKIGFVIQAQMDNLLKSLPKKSTVLSRRTSMIDVSTEVKKNLSTKRQKDDMTLWRVCKDHLGMPLDNSERWSVWSREPLRKAQVEYATLNAYCMLMLRDKMQLTVKQPVEKMEH